MKNGKFRRIISFLLGAIMVLGAFPVTVFANEEPAITLASDVFEAEKGDEVEVTAAIANNPGFVSMAVLLQYDEKVLEFKGLKKVLNNYGQEVTAGLFGAGTCEYNGNKIAYAGTSEIAVDNDLFTAVFEVVGSGETEVSVSVEEFKNASGKSFAEAVTVFPSGAVKVETEEVPVSLDITKLTITEGKTAVITATVVPEEKAEENVASAENGIITAVSAGEAVIRASVGENFAECKVTVTEFESYFDYVIFDEASQVKIEDSIGAFLRAKKYVVMGDTKQLPPTTFFEKDNDIDEIDEDSYAADSESILHLCKNTTETRMLKWHYRSRHDSLITVSNNEFYDNKLYVFPSPMIYDEDLGLKFEYDPTTEYQRGSGKNNIKEAENLIEYAFNLIRKYGNTRSIGVATFNIPQRNTILDILENKLKEHPELEEYFDESGKEGFFVKNLENIRPLVAIFSPVRCY